MLAEGREGRRGGSLCLIKWWPASGLGGAAGRAGAPAGPAK